MVCVRVCPCVLCVPLRDSLEAVRMCVRCVFVTDLVSRCGAAAAGLRYRLQAVTADSDAAKKVIMGTGGCAMCRG